MDVGETLWIRTMPMFTPVDFYSKLDLTLTTNIDPFLTKREPLPPRTICCIYIYKASSKPINNHLSNPVHRQTVTQTDTQMINTNITK